LTEIASLRASVHDAEGRGSAMMMALRGTFRPMEVREPVIVLEE
jgi:hypothetical protein